MQNLFNLLSISLISLCVGCSDDIVENQNNGNVDVSHKADLGNDDDFSNDSDDASSEPPPRFCVNVSPNSIAFGIVKVDQNVSADLTVSNCGADELEISVFAQAPFKTPLSQAALEPGAEILFPIVFEPKEVGAASSVVTVSAGDSRFDVQVAGTGELL